MPIIPINPLKKKGFSSLEATTTGHYITFNLYAPADIVDQYEEYFENIVMQCREANAMVNFVSTASGMTLTVTAPVDVQAQLFDAIFQEKRYPAATNVELYKERNRLFEKLISETKQQKKEEMSEPTHSMHVPPKGKILSKDQSKSSVFVTKDPRLVESSMSYIGEARKPQKPDRHFLKHNRSKDMDSQQRHEAAMVEAFYFELGRLSNPVEMVPKASSVHDPAKDYKAVMVMIKEIKGFRSLDEIFKNENRSLTQDELIEKGIASVLVDAYMSMENDCRGGNIGEDERNALRRLDFGQSGWPLTAPYTLLRNLFWSDDYSVERLGVRIKPQDSFPITERDVINFPNLEDAKPINWASRTPYEIENNMRTHMAGLDRIEQNAKFIKQKYFYFLKRALLDPEIIKSIGRATIAEDTSDLRRKHVDMQLARMEKLKNLLPNIAQFREYFAKYGDDYQQQLINEAKNYNAQFKAKEKDKDVIVVDGERYKAKYKDRLIDISNFLNSFKNMIAEAARPTPHGLK